MWVHADAWNAFVAQARELDRVRRGGATVASLSPGELELELHATDALGHMAVRGSIERRARGIRHALVFGFAFAPDRLPDVVQALAEAGACE